MAGERMYTKLCRDQGGKEDGGKENDLMTLEAPAVKG